MIETIINIILILVIAVGGIGLAVFGPFIPDYIASLFRKKDEQH